MNSKRPAVGWFGGGLTSTVWLVCFAVLTTAVQSSATADDFTTAVREVLRDYTDVERGEVGMVVGLVDENGMRVIGYGRTGTDGSEVNGDTVFEIGSITKTFTALLLQEMVERGQMKLDAPVAKYLPGSVKPPTHGSKEITLLTSPLTPLVFLAIRAT